MFLCSFQRTGYNSRNSYIGAEEEGQQAKTDLQRILYNVSNGIPIPGEKRIGATRHPIERYLDKTLLLPAKREIISDDQQQQHVLDEQITCDPALAGRSRATRRQNRGELRKRRRAETELLLLSLEAQHRAGRQGREPVAERAVQEAVEGIRVVGRRRVLCAQRPGFPVLLPAGENRRDGKDR